MARVFNGTTDLIQVNSAHLTNGATAFSVSAWIKSVPVVFAQIYSEGSNGLAGPFFFISLDGSTGVAVTVQMRTLTSGSVDTMTGTRTAADSTWHHVCVTQTAASFITLYVDGVQDTTFTRTVLSNSNTQVFNTATIGAIVRVATGNFFSGTIAETATWTRTLAAAEAALLAGGTRASQFAPDYYWPLLGVASPEPDMGTASVVNGTLTGTTSAVGPNQVDYNTFIPSRGRRPVPMIKGPDKDKILSMRGNSY